MGKMGRPRIMNDRIRQDFLARVASGRSVRDVCSDADMPSRPVIYEELAANKDFADHYARACDMRADEVFDEMVQIADTPMIGETTKILPSGERETTEGDMIAHRRLQVDVRKWALARMSPRKYGEKLAVGGAEDLPAIKSETLTDTEFARRVAFLLAQGMKEAAK